jgi:hypothetical protein
MAQWYENVPVCWNAKENFPPGATIPEFQPVASEVDVWEVESVFVHVTVVPTATSRAAGVKALFPRASAPTGIETDAAAPPGAGVGAGVGVGVGDGVGLGEV